MTNGVQVDENQYLSFKMGEEMFALPIASVREVLELNKLTKVPKTPEFMKGVINLRGRVVPVVDIKQKFGMGITSPTIDTCIIIVEIAIEEDMIIVGAMVDSVQSVIDLEPQEIEPAPRIGTHLNVEFIEGMGKKNEEFIIILNVNKVFSLEELTTVIESQKIQNIEEISTEVEENKV